MKWFVKTATAAMTVMTMTLATGTTPMACAANDPPQQQQAEPQVQVLTDGTAQTVLRGDQIHVHTDSADGTTAIVVQGDQGTVLRVRDGKVELMNAVPADVEKKIEEVREAARKKTAERGAAANARAQAHIQEHIDRLKGLQEQMQDGDVPQKRPGFGFGMQGTITVIGPDGVKHMQTFGNGTDNVGNGNDNGPLPDIQRLLEKALENAGADLPEEVRKKLEEAFKQPDQRLQAVDAAKGPPGEAGDISRKLDRILERLEKLEKDVDELTTMTRKHSTRE